MTVFAVMDRGLQQGWAVEGDRKVNQMKEIVLKWWQVPWGRVRLTRSGVGWGRKGGKGEVVGRKDGSECRASRISYPLRLIARLSQIKIRIY